MPSGAGTQEGTPLEAAAGSRGPWGLGRASQGRHGASRVSSVLGKDDSSSLTEGGRRGRDRGFLEVDSTVRNHCVCRKFLPE